eukprot:2958247-Prymnesium_polylepis.1
MHPATSIQGLTIAAIFASRAREAGPHIDWRAGWSREGCGPVVLLHDKRVRRLEPPSDLAKRREGIGELANKSVVARAAARTRIRE